MGLPLALRSHGRSRFCRLLRALSIYQPLDAASIALEPVDSAANEALSPLPVQLALSLDENARFVRTLAAIRDDAQLERLQSLLLLLVNKALSAEPAEPGDLEKSRQVLTRVVATLSLGLETLSRGDEETAVSCLHRIALEKIFRVGFTLTLQLHRLCKTLLNQGEVRLPSTPALLLDPPYDGLCRALTDRRPQFPLELDGKKFGVRPFATLADIGRAAQALKEAAQIGPLVFSLVDQNRLMEQIADCGLVPSQVRFGTLVRTLAANFLLGRGWVADPVEASALPALTTAAARLTECEPALRGLLVERSVAIPPELHLFVERWLGDFGAQLSRPDGLLVKLATARAKPKRGQ